MDADPTTLIPDGAPSAFHPGSCSPLVAALSNIEPIAHVEPLTLVAGKRYATVGGGKTGPLSAYSPLFPEYDKSAFVDTENMRAYTADGRHWMIQFSEDKSPTPFDIAHQLD